MEIKFVEAALSDSRQAEAMLAADPNLAKLSPFTALVSGLRTEDTDRIPVDVPGGPKNWLPLLYTCFSALPRKADLANLARALISRGADPNASCLDKRWPDNPLPCLYAATGLNNNPALALVLLQAGANPNDSESLYHSTEHADLECLRLLLKHGAVPARTNALKHMLDRDDIEGLQLLLDAGADPNELNHRGETALHWAVWRGRSLAHIQMLLDRGASLDKVRTDGRTAYALAIRSGQKEIAEFLKAHGAGVNISRNDLFLASPGSVPVEDVDLLEVAKVLPDLAVNHNLTTMRALLSAGVAPTAGDEQGATALHWACLKGDSEMVALLLQYGAPLDVKDNEYHATPEGWYRHGFENSFAEGDYPGVARLLAASNQRDGII